MVPFACLNPKEPMLEEMPRESYITLTESAHYPDAIPIWLAEEAHICYSVDLRVA